MPSKNSIKTYIAASFYHIYNRGVEKRNIFLEDIDYRVMLSYLQTYLLPKDEQRLYAVIADPNAYYKDKNNALKLLRLNNFSKSITLLSFCLMTNHYHMIIRQHEELSMDSFMNSLWTRYTMYFNKKYKRVGPLFQDVYKAVLIQSDEQLLHLSRYIHVNNIAKHHFTNLASKGDALRGYFYSSYQDYIGLRKLEWVHPEYILSYWNKNPRMSYENFVLQPDFEDSARIIAPIISV
jgi:putative transposase